MIGERGVIVRRATIFRPSLVETTSDRRTPVSVPAPHDVLSVVVQRDTLSQWRLATVTTETGKPSVAFSSSITGVSVGSTAGTQPARAPSGGRGVRIAVWQPDLKVLVKRLDLQHIHAGRGGLLRPTE